MEAIEKQFGKGAIMQMNESVLLDVQGISTGALSLDIALGGRACRAAGSSRFMGRSRAARRPWPCTPSPTPRSRAASRPSSTPNTPSTRAGQAHRRRSGGTAGQPAANAEEALKIAEMLIKSNAVDIIVIDSVAALVPRAEVEGEIGDSHMGIIARLMSQALRILTPASSRSKTCMIFINQIRQKIGVMYGNPETTSGGLALKFYSSVRLDVRKGDRRQGRDEIDRQRGQGARWSRTRWRRPSAWPCST